MTQRESSEHMARTLREAASAHRSRDFARLQSLYDQADADAPRESGVDGVAIAYALRLLDAWVDAYNHRWQYHEPIESDDWPALAEEVAASLSDGGVFSPPKLRGVEVRAP
jgi:hypothetical protein